MERTAPALLGLYSLVCLSAGDFLARSPHPFKAFWYEKTSFTFPDAIAAVRARLWLDCIFQRSPADRERPETPPPGTASSLVCGLVDEGNLPMAPPGKVKRMIETLCFAAGMYKTELRANRLPETIERIEFQDGISRYEPPLGRVHHQRSIISQLQRN